MNQDRRLDLKLRLLRDAAIKCALIHQPANKEA